MSAPETGISSPAAEDSRMQSKVDDEDDDQLLKALFEERERFSKLSPLPTFLILSVGPIMMQVGAALHDSVDLYMISQSFGSYGIGAAGLAALIRFMCEGVALYFGFAASIMIPWLIGESRQLAAKQIIVDLYRVALVLSIPLTIVIYFVTEPMLKYMGCPPTMLPDSMAYITPIIVTMPGFILLQLSVGIIQGEGRSIVCGLIQFGVFILNCAVLAPIVFYGAKAPLGWGGTPYMFAHVIPGIALFLVIMSGCFSVKPTWAMWRNPLQKEVWTALKLASSFIVFLVANVFPPMLTVHYLLLAASNIGDLLNVNSAFNVYMKVGVFVGSWTEGFSQGFMAAGAYATGAKDIMRFVRLALWGFIFCLVSQVIFLPLVVPDPWWVGSIWLSSDIEKSWARKLNAIPFYTQFLQASCEVTNCICMSFGNAWIPIVSGVFKGVANIVSVLCLYHTADGKTSPPRILHSYTTMNIAVFCLDLFFFFTVIIPHVRRQRDVMKVGETGELGDLSR
jgi:Na+-driven multidrug efflux pump